MPMVAAKRAVSVPMIATTVSAMGARSKIAEERATMYTPAVTIVAAWISAETGVGPSMASGSQTYRGICADLPAAPTIKSSPIAVSVPAPAVSAGNRRTDSNTRVKSSDPKCLIIKKRAIRNPKSPMRLTMNAFLPAAAAESFVNQNPISRYDARPTPSQPMNMTR